MNVYIFQGDPYCEDCILALGWTTVDDLGDSELRPYGPCPVGEADTPQHCGECNGFLENPLTRDGQYYVRWALYDYLLLGIGDPDTIRQWAEFYNAKVEIDD